MSTEIAISNGFDSKQVVEAVAEKTIELIREGRMRVDVRDNIKKYFSGCRSKDREEGIKEGYKRLQREWDKGILQNIWVHLRRYQNMVNEIRGFDYSGIEEDEERYKKMVQNGFELLNTLLAKEKIVGFHRKVTTVKLKEESPKLETLKLNFSNLTTEQKKRALQLIKKAKSGKEISSTETTLEPVVEISSTETTLEPVVEISSTTANIEFIKKVKLEDNLVIKPKTSSEILSRLKKLL